MFGNNPKRSPVKGNGLDLEVQSIFATLQGEGPYTGHPAIFIRLGGCNLACHFCDTEFESFKTISLEEIYHRVSSLNPNNTYKLIVITGGEPLRQPLIPLCEKLINAGYTVQIETNGTLYQPLPDSVDIICSPKPSNTGYHPIRADLLARITAFKFIISKQQPLYQTIGEVGQDTYNQPIYVQPMDEQNETINKQNTMHTLYLAQKYGYRFSIQLHKILEIE